MQAMNVARGYRRFAIAVVGSWIATWAAIGAHAAWQQSVWSNVFISASRDRASVTELVLSNQKSQEYGELVGASMAWGALAIPMAIGFAVIWWVYRGFRGNDSR